MCNLWQIFISLYVESKSDSTKALSLEDLIAHFDTDFCLRVLLKISWKML